MDIKKNNNANKFQKIRTLLESISLRRRKDSVLDGKPILILPSKKITKIELELTPDEREFYEALQHNSLERFKELERLGTLRKNMMNVLVLLLRLRQACCHARLTKVNPMFDLEETEGSKFVNDKQNRYKNKSKVGSGFDNLHNNITEGKFDNELLQTILRNDPDNGNCYICSSR